MRKVITLSREDTHAFQHIYQEIGVTFPQRLQVLEFVEWLAAQARGGRSAPCSVRPCWIRLSRSRHTPRISGGRATARRVLAADSGRARLAKCSGEKGSPRPAGTVGGFQCTQPALAEKLAGRGSRRRRRRGRRGIVTEDPQCTAQLAKYAEGLPVVKPGGIDRRADLATGPVAVVRFAHHRNLIQQGG